MGDCDDISDTELVVEHVPPRFETSPISSTCDSQSIVDISDSDNFQTVDTTDNIELISDVSDGELNDKYFVDIVSNEGNKPEKKPKKRRGSTASNLSEREQWLRAQPQTVVLDNKDSIELISDGELDEKCFVDIVNSAVKKPKKRRGSNDSNISERELWLRAQRQMEPTHRVPSPEERHFHHFRHRNEFFTDPNPYYLQRPFQHHPIYEHVDLRLTKVVTVHEATPIRTEKEQRIFEEVCKKMNGPIKLPEKKKTIFEEVCEKINNVKTTYPINEPIFKEVCKKRNKVKTSYPSPINEPIFKEVCEKINKVKTSYPTPINEPIFKEVCEKINNVGTTYLTPIQENFSTNYIAKKSRPIIHSSEKNCLVINLTEDTPKEEPPLKKRLVVKEAVPLDQNKKLLVLKRCEKIINLMTKSPIPEKFIVKSSYKLPDRKFAGRSPILKVPLIRFKFNSQPKVKIDAFGTALNTLLASVGIRKRIESTNQLHCSVCGEHNSKEMKEEGTQCNVSVETNSVGVQVDENDLLKRSITENESVVEPKTKIKITFNK